MPTEIPHFLDCDSGKMFTLEHHPDVDGPTYWVISLNSGLQCRTGPRRLYLSLARRLAESGFGVIRVDLPGVGDSDGAGPEIHFDMHNPDDVDVIINYVLRKFRPKGIILHGLCAGSRVAVKSAARNSNVAAILAWSTPILTTTPGMPSPPEGPRHGVSKAVAEYNKGRIFSVFREAKFLRLSFWRHHLTSRNFVPELKRTFWSGLLLLRGKPSRNYEGPFIRSLRSYIGSQRPIQFIYGERDTCAYHELDDLGLELSEEDYVILPDGTHTLSTADQKHQAVEDALSWLQKRFGDRD